MPLQNGAQKKKFSVIGFEGFGRNGAVRQLRKSLKSGKKAPEPKFLGVESVHSSCLGRRAKRELSIFELDLHNITWFDSASHNRTRELILHFFLDVALERPRSVDGVIG